jgi:anaerobic magnesium-protoporphyrin IX monomethyl ester cyclase
MKVLLILPPKIEQGEKSKHLFSNLGSVLPLGLAYIGAVLEKAGHSVKVLDYQLPEVTNEALIGELKSGYDAVGISITTLTSYSGYNIAKMIKENSPKTVVIAGGPHTIALGEAVIDECKDVDYFVYGEGEMTIVELLAAIGSGIDPKSVNGIGFMSKEGKVVTKPREMIEKLDDLPLPAYHLFDVQSYRPVAGMFKRLPFANIMTSRGCPFNCAFCNKLVWGYKMRMRSPKNIIEEVKLLREKYGVREIAFFDDTFTMDKNRVIELCNLLRESAPGLIWKCSTRVDSISPELLKQMKAAGCYSIGFGLESGNQDMLNRINKGITLEQSRSAIKMAKKAGLETRAYFMLNLPGDTKETTEQTIKFSRELDPDFVDFEITHPYPNTNLWKSIENDPTFTINKAKWTDWSAHAGNEIVFTQGSLPEDYIKDAYVRANRGFYMRPIKFLKLMKFALSDVHLFRSYLRAFRNVIKIKVPK